MRGAGRPRCRITTSTGGIQRTADRQEEQADELTDQPDRAAFVLASYLLGIVPSTDYY
jgi:hypothetical protein